MVCRKIGVGFPKCDFRAKMTTKKEKNTETRKKKDAK
jgi:hypothetical protein